jgi:hypothetical protein
MEVAKEMVREGLVKLCRVIVELKYARNVNTSSTKREREEGVVASKSE